MRHIRSKFIENVNFRAYWRYSWKYFLYLFIQFTKTYVRYNAISLILHSTKQYNFSMPSTIGILILFVPSLYDNFILTHSLMLLPHTIWIIQHSLWMVLNQFPVGNLYAMRRYSSRYSPPFAELNEKKYSFYTSSSKTTYQQTPDSHLFFFRASHITWKINLSSFVICTRNTFPFP